MNIYILDIGLNTYIAGSDYFQYTASIYSLKKIIFQFSIPGEDLHFANGAY